MNYQILSHSQRLNRIFTGAVLIVSTMLISVNPLGWFAVLPLLATYPLFAGIYGYDPVADIIRYLVHSWINTASRIVEHGHRSRHI